MGNTLAYVRVLVTTGKPTEYYHKTRNAIGATSTIIQHECHPYKDIIGRIACATLVPVGS